MDFTKHTFYEFPRDVNLSEVDRFPFGDNEGRLFQDCPLLDCCVLSHMFPCHLPKLYEYLESQGCLRLNSLYYPPSIIGFMNGEFLSVHEKVRLLEELFYGHFTITPTDSYLSYFESQHPNSGGLWSTSVSGFQSATPKTPRPDYLVYNSRNPHKYDVMGTNKAKGLPILFMFDNVSWRRSESQPGKQYGIPLKDDNPVYFNDARYLRVMDFDLSVLGQDTEFVTSSGMRFSRVGYLKIQIKSFDVVF